MWRTVTGEHHQCVACGSYRDLPLCLLPFPYKQTQRAAIPCTPILVEIKYYRHDALSGIVDLIHIPLVIRDWRVNSTSNTGQRDSN